MGNCFVVDRAQVQPKKNHRKKKRKDRDHAVTGHCPGNFVRSHYHDLRLDYTPVKTLGGGASGEVHLAVHNETGRQRAIKRIPLQCVEDVDEVQKEIEIMKNLDHPNIVRIYELYRSYTEINIVMEYCRGGELFDRIVKQKKLTERLAATYIFDITSAVNYLHSLSIAHRDLKPENLLLESEDEHARVKLADFGTAKSYGNQNGLVSGIGTCYYMAPEVMQGSYDWRCDIWSIGVILYILLSGFPPFNASSDTEIYRKILSEPVSFKHSVWRSVSQSAKELIVQMLSKNPEHRPTLQEVLAHPWMQKRAQTSETQAIANEAFENFVKFQSSSQLLGASLTFIAAQLLTEQQQTHLANLFNEIDRDRDGKLSVKELQCAMANTPWSSLVENMLSADLNGDGFIEYSEFLTAAVNWSTELNKERLYQAFKQYDINGDGKISLEEINTILGDSRSRPSLFNSIMEEADLNGDGEIDFNEFCEYIYKKLS